MASDDYSVLTVNPLKSNVRKSDVISSVDHCKIGKQNIILVAGNGRYVQCVDTT
jgi:hypothetical protein